MKSIFWKVFVLVVAAGLITFISVQWFQKKYEIGRSSNEVSYSSYCQNRKFKIEGVGRITLENIDQAPYSKGKIYTDVKPNVSQEELTSILNKYGYTTNLSDSFEWKNSVQTHNKTAFVLVPEGQEKEAVDLLTSYSIFSGVSLSGLGGGPSPYRSKIKINAGKDNRWMAGEILGGIYKNKLKTRDEIKQFLVSLNEPILMIGLDPMNEMYAVHLRVPDCYEDDLIRKLEEHPEFKSLEKNKVFRINSRSF